MSSPTPISVLQGQVVVRWQGLEMALSEGLPSAGALWEDPAIPFLQLVNIDVELANGQAFRIVSQSEDGTGFHGLFVLELERPPGLSPASDLSSIYRDRELHELPTGKVVVTGLRKEGPNATIEAKLRIGDADLSLLAAEVHEQLGGCLAIVEPDESILVQVNGLRPKPRSPRRAQ